MRQQRLFSFLQYILFPAIGLFLVWWQLRGMSATDKAEFYAALQKADYGLVALAAVLSLLSHISRAMRWQLLLEPLGSRPPFKNLFAATMAGYLANAALPRVGELVRCTLLARYSTLPVNKLLGTVLAERALDLLCYLILIVATVLIQLDVVGQQVQQLLRHLKLPGWATLALGATVAAALLLLTRWLLQRLAHISLVQKVQQLAKGLLQGFGAIRRLHRQRLFWAHTVFIWGLYLLQVYVGFKAVEATAHLGLSAAFSVLALATLAIMLTPGGIGAFPLFVMQTLVIYDIPNQQGKAFGWLMWGTSTSIVLIVGLASLLLLPYINKSSNK
jgi:glycosyltransferase 2 family protein